MPPYHVPLPCCTPAKSQNGTTPGYIAHPNCRVPCDVSHIPNSVYASRQKRRLPLGLHLGSGDGAQQLCLQNELALLVLFARLVSLVVLPADCLLALPAVDVADYVATGRHVALVGIRLGDVDDAVKEVGFAVLAAEVLQGVSATLRVSGCIWAR